MAAIQRGLENGNRGITIVRNRYQATIVKILGAGKVLA
jgi:hypothetical protein